MRNRPNPTKLLSSSRVGESENRFNSKSVPGGGVDRLIPLLSHLRFLRGRSLRDHEIPRRSSRLSDDEINNRSSFPTVEFKKSQVACNQSVSRIAEAVQSVQRRIDIPEPARPERVTVFGSAVNFISDNVVTARVVVIAVAPSGREALEEGGPLARFFN